jgi:NAD(P)-dependent dehydrogenase (short-subunit alcohol dehydrogenase family)
MIHDRDATTGREAADTLTKEGLDVRFVELDVTRMETISAAAARIEADFGKLDVLVNNAGIADPAVFHDWIDGQGPSIVYAKGGFGLSAQPIELLQRHIELSKNLEEQRRADFPSCASPILRPAKNH